VVNMRDDTKVTDEAWIHQLARRRKTYAPVKFSSNRRPTGLLVCPVRAAEISRQKQNNSVCHK
jgi:hypothetical protein